MSESQETLEHVPLEARHVELGGRMVPFAGFLMPLQYKGIKQEHLAVRQAVGLFDVSHMGEIEVKGADAIDVVDRLVTNDVTRLVDGQALYTVMCREDGTIVDDLLVYRLSAEHLLLCVNASNRSKDLEHILAHATGESSITHTSEAWAQLALQGPRALELAATLTDLDLASLGYFHAAFATFAGAPDVLVSRTGYTGEEGVELYIPVAHAEQVFDAIVAAGEPFGLELCGLGARDTLRLEARLHLYGQDMNDETSPIEAGLGWVVKLKKQNDFVGKQAIARIKEQGPARKLVGFVVQDRGIIRQGCEITHEGQVIGEITSGSFSYMLDTSVGLGYVEAQHAALEELDVMVRGKALRARVTSKPFYKNT